jgi:cobyrinic acid a,c-diamide synthase
VRTFLRASEGADIAVAEGVMGLFDGASPTGEEGSTAEIAKWLGAPVLLVVDASGMARSIAAVARGFATFDPDLRLEGIVCNRVGSRGHLELLAKACGRPRVFGGFTKHPELAFPERHLGLFAADESAASAKTIDAWGEAARDELGVDAIIDLARSAPALAIESETGTRAPTGESCRIGIAWDEAFHFYYEDNLARLESLGARLVRFSPVRDASLPDVDGLYFGGGYPEAFTSQLSDNRSMRDAVLAFARADKPVYAECGGLMYLSRSIRTGDGMGHPMVGLLPAETIMKDRLVALGYVEVETQAATMLGPAGSRFRGHQFRYSELGPIEGSVSPPYHVRRRRGGDASPEGFAMHQVVASYVHAHWASNPRIAESFVAACASRKGAT